MDRPVPVPRPLIRCLAQERRPVLIATTVGHLTRGMFLRKGACVSGGRCKASWIADVFGVDLRNVKAARRMLIQDEWIVPVKSSQTAMNRWGQAFVVNLERRLECPAGTGKTPPPRPVICRNSPPPGDNKKLLIGSGTPEPAGRGPSGACAGRGSNQTPRLCNVVLKDLRQPARTAALFHAAVRRGSLRNTACDRLRVFAAAEHAKMSGTRNACGLFVWLLRERKWGHINQHDEDRACAVIRYLEALPEQTCQGRMPTNFRKNSSASNAAGHAGPEAARQILAGTGTAAYPILAAVSAALNASGSPQSPEPTESLPGKNRWLGPTRELAGYSLGLSKGVV